MRGEIDVPNGKGYIWGRNGSGFTSVGPQRVEESEMTLVSEEKRRFLPNRHEPAEWLVDLVIVDLVIGQSALYVSGGFEETRWRTRHRSRW
ncbi:hypothetical protein COCNU_contig69410831G000010 [Cocos nucifera]|nr:hypothetical protein [Cocos nucifera]